MLSDQKPNAENILFSRDMENRKEIDDAVRDHGSKSAVVYDMESLATSVSSDIAYGLDTFAGKKEPADLLHWLKHKVWAALQEQQRRNFALQTARNNLTGRTL